MHEPGQDNSGMLDGLLRLTGFIAILVVGILIYIAFGSRMKGCLIPKGEVPDIEFRGSGISAAMVDSNGIHVPTGFVYAPGIVEMQRNCTGCHSPKLITQARATREGWIQIIQWMQSTQGLRDLGDDKNIILDYLSMHYAPEERGRRANLDSEAIKWYVLEE